MIAGDRGCVPRVTRLQQRKYRLIATNVKVNMINLFYPIVSAPLFKCLQVQGANIGASVTTATITECGIKTSEAAAKGQR